MSLLHPLLARLLRRVGASAEATPSKEAWGALLGLISRTYQDADQDRYTIERAMDVSSIEMQRLYRAFEAKTAHEISVVRQSDERHRLLFDRNPLPIWVIDAEGGRFLAVNEAMVDTYGYTRDELLAMRLPEVCTGGGAVNLLRRLGEAPLVRIEHVGTCHHRSKQGGLLDIDLTIHEIAFEGHRAVLGIGLDVTRARALEDDLRQAQKMEAVGQLAGGIAHDFNNILSVILASAEFAIEDLGDDHPVVPEVVEIREAAARAAGLTRQLLMFSRKRQRQTRAVSLNTVVTDVGGMLARIVGEDISMSATIAPDLGMIDADPGELEQVLLNLVVNARDAMPAGGKLAIETCNVTLDAAHAERLSLSPGGYVSLSVRDTGTGMTAHVRARIFEPFFTTKDVDRGTGLGLAMVFGVVRQGRGAICVDSEPNQGTTFRIYWPRIQVAEAAAPAPAPVPVRGSGVVLVVEDDHQLRHVLRRYLTSWGYTPLEAPGGMAALELIRAHDRTHDRPIDLMLTDLVMPGLDGRSLSELVRIEKPSIKVVFMSGYTEHAALDNAALGPDDHFVQKPFAAHTLADAIHRALSGQPPSHENHLPVESQLPT